MNPHEITITNQPDCSWPSLVQAARIAIGGGFFFEKVINSTLVLECKAYGEWLLLNPNVLHPGDAVTVAKELGAVLYNNDNGTNEVTEYVKWGERGLVYCNKDGKPLPAGPCDNLTGWRIHSIPQFNLRRC